MVDVAHQDHYESQAIQPIQYMAVCLTPDEFKGYLKGNIIKYISRANKKNGADDLKKAQVYNKWLVEFTETGKITV